MLRTNVKVGMSGKNCTGTADSVFQNIVKCTLNYRS